MINEVETTIIHFYPKRALVSPLDDDHIRWNYDEDNSILRGIVADLKKLDPQLRNGTRGRYDISEELIVFGEIHLQLCYLGPYAALNYGFVAEPTEDARERGRRVQKVVEKHGLKLLAEKELREQVAWIQHGSSATVWNCLFVHPEN